VPVHSAPPTYPTWVTWSFLVFGLLFYGWGPGTSEMVGASIFCFFLGPSDVLIFFSREGSSSDERGGVVSVVVGPPL